MRSSRHSNYHPFSLYVHAYLLQQFLSIAQVATSLSVFVMDVGFSQLPLALILAGLEIASKLAKK